MSSGAAPASGYSALDAMKLAAVLPLSLSDFPGELAAVAFTPGCNFRCPYCHNPQLVETGRCDFDTPRDVDATSRGSDGKAAEKAPGGSICGDASAHRDLLDGRSLLDFLSGRTGKLSGLVVTGGEPSLHHGLHDFLRYVKSLGFKVKLDTNGSRPDVLETLLSDGLVDYVAMDVKAPPHKYSDLAGIEVDFTLIRRSIDILCSARIFSEFRTTAVAPLLTVDDLVDISSMLERADLFVLQTFRPGRTLIPGFGSTTNPLPRAEMQSACEKIRELGIRCRVRS